MYIFKHARLTPLGRAELAYRLLDGDQSISQVTNAFHVYANNARKWTERLKQACAEGLSDRSSRLQRLRKPTPHAGIDEIVALHCQRFTGKAYRQGLSRQRGNTKPRSQTRPGPTATPSVSFKLPHTNALMRPAYASFDRRVDELPVWMHSYNRHRTHGGIKYQTPISPPRSFRGQPAEAS